MARKLRIQYEGVIYHVINRGNYRQDIYSSLKMLLEKQRRKGMVCKEWLETCGEACLTISVCSILLAFFP